MFSPSLEITHKVLLPFLRLTENAFCLYHCDLQCTLLGIRLILQLV